MYILGEYIYTVENREIKNIRNFIYKIRNDMSIVTFEFSQKEKKIIGKNVL